MLKSARIVTVLLLSGTAWLAYRCLDAPPNSSALYADKASFGTRADLNGSTRTDYVATTHQILAGKTRFVGATVSRNYTHIEHIEQPFFGLRSEATIQVAYRAEYAFGYDLAPGSFTVTGDSKGITVTVAKPRLVATPAAVLLSYRIPDHGLFIDEKRAIIELQQRLQPLAQLNAASIASEPAVAAQCERSLRSFLEAFLSKQSGRQPAVVIAYR